MDPKHTVFVIHLLQLINGTHEIDSENPFIVIFDNFSNVHRKIPKHMVLEYTTRSTMLQIPVDTTLVAHITESLGYFVICDQDVVEQSPPSLVDKKPPDPWDKLLNTPVASTTPPVFSP